MKSSENFLRPFRRTIALNIADYKNQEAEQHGNFDDIVKEKLNTCYPSVGKVKSHRGKSPAEEIIEPLHSEDLPLKEVPS